MAFGKSESIEIATIDNVLKRIILLPLRKEGG